MVDRAQEPTLPSESLDIDELIEEQLWEQAMERFRVSPHHASRIVNPSLGWTKLHWLCSLGASPAELIELVASLYPEAVTLPDNRYGDTPLHILCRNSQTSARKLKILLKFMIKDNEGSPSGVLIRNRFGGTPLHSASNHNAVLEVLQLLVEANPKVLRLGTHDGIMPVSALYTAYIQTIPGYMQVAHILKGENDNPSAHFERFWRKVVFLTTADREAVAETSHDETTIDARERYVLFGLLHSHVMINFYQLALKKDPSYASVTDADGNYPLHVLLDRRPFRLKERRAIQATLEAYPRAALQRNHKGDLPLTIAIRNKIPWENGVDCLLETARSTVHQRDASTNLWPFQLAASVGGRVAIDTTFQLLCLQPDLLQRE